MENSSEEFLPQKDRWARWASSWGALFFLALTNILWSAVFFWLEHRHAQQETQCRAQIIELQNLDIKRSAELDTLSKRVETERSRADRLAAELKQKTDASKK